MEKAGDMKPTHYSRFIGVDEFSLHKRHRYATIVIDLETGESLFVEEGNSQWQLHHFFRFVGHDFMMHVKAIAMDMNAQYASAIRNRYPHIKAEMLKLSFTCDNVDEFKTSLNKWLQIASRANIPELNKFCKMVERHYEGIINHAIFHISNGTLEGTNNLIKTIRRQAYGYRDQQYFFLKIMEATRKKPKQRFYKSHRFRA